MCGRPSHYPGAPSCTPSVPFPEAFPLLLPRYLIPRMALGSVQMKRSWLDYAPLPSHP